MIADYSGEDKKLVIDSLDGIKDLKAFVIDESRTFEETDDISEELKTFKKYGVILITGKKINVKGK